jgi:tRNA A37 methylthiotransferase MiaB
MSVQREISESINESRIGLSINVIIDGAVRAPEVPGFSHEGRTPWDAPDVDGKVYVKGHDVKTGDIVPVVIQSANEYDLFGEHRSSPSGAG